MVWYCSVTSLIHFIPLTEAAVEKFIGGGVLMVGHFGIGADVGAPATP